VISDRWAHAADWSFATLFLASRREKQKRPCFISLLTKEITDDRDLPKRWKIKGDRMKKQLHIAIAALLVSLSLPLKGGAADNKTPEADKVPEYEGVYLLTIDNELIQLHSLNVKPCDITISNSTYDILSGKGRRLFRYAPLSAVTNIPVVPTDKVKGLYIVARDERIEAINMLALLDQFLAGGSIITGAHDGGCASGDLRDPSAYLAFSTWGWQSNTFRVKPLNGFTTYFDLKDHKLGPTTTGTITSTTGDSIWAPGLYVSTNKHFYPFLPSTTVLAFLYRNLALPGADRAPLNAQLLPLAEILDKSTQPKSAEAIWAWTFSAKVYRVNRLYDKALATYTDKIIPAARDSGNKEVIKRVEDELKQLQDETKPK
jgi:hypothetical protein